MDSKSKKETYAPNNRGLDTLQNNALLKIRLEIDGDGGECKCEMTYLQGSPSILQRL